MKTVHGVAKEWAPRVESRAALERLAREVLARDLTDPLWPGLTESDWATDAQKLAVAYLLAVGKSPSNS